jgi:hypothetical protein
MALLDMQAVSPHLERTSIVRVINYKVNEEEKFAVSDLRMRIDFQTCLNTDYIGEGVLLHGDFV